MARQDRYLNINSDDDYASRVFALSLKFYRSRGPLSSSNIRADLYPTLDEGSFMRQYLRDRSMLAGLGVVVREAGEAERDKLWKVDEQASYVQGDDIDPADARMLFVLCYDMAFDQAFAYRDELRLALAKISRMYGGVGITQTDDTTPQEHKSLSVLVDCLSNREAVNVRYTNAQGVTTDRRLALLGSFGLRARSYFVASRIERDGSLVPGSLRTYRLDRFERVTPCKPTLSYQIPLDFSVDDYKRLPFQMGDHLGFAQLDIGGNPSREVTNACASNGRMVGDNLWEVSYSSIRDLASWCVGNSVHPVAPAELAEQWRDIFARSAASQPYQPELSQVEGRAQEQARKGHAGRSGSLMLVRQLMALAASLTTEDEKITAQQVADTLGISYDRARHLIMLVSMSSGDSYDYLPVVPDDEYHEVFLMKGARMTAPRIRLTRTETMALQAALTELGVPGDDPLAKALTSSFAAPSFSVDDVARSLELPNTSADTATLRTCSQAIGASHSLRFAYQPIAGGAPTRRHVVPQLVRRNDDNWYLDAFDLDKQDFRVFRVDRMQDVVTSDAVQTHQVPLRKRSAQSIVVVRFCDPAYLDLFYWEGLEVLDRSNQGTLVRLPSYGGSWLARHLVACAGTVQVSDQALAARMQELAAQMV